MTDTTTNTGGSAFPQPHYTDANGQVQLGDNGMTLRDWFAGQALLAMVAMDDKQVCKSRTPEGVEAEQQEYAAGIAKASYRYADAMLAAREGRTNG